MSNIATVRNGKAEAAINAFRIVKHGAADGQFLLGAAVGDKLIGVSTDIPAAINERVDVITAGIADLEFGGAVTRGDPLTSDAVGRGVLAAPGVGVNNRIIGFAWVSGVLGDIGQVEISQGVIQG